MQTTAQHSQASYKQGLHLNGAWMACHTAAAPTPVAVRSPDSFGPHGPSEKHALSQWLDDSRHQIR